MQNRPFEFVTKFLIASLLAGTASCGSAQQTGSDQQIKEQALEILTDAEHPLMQDDRIKIKAQEAMPSAAADIEHFFQQDSQGRKALIKDTPNVAPAVAVTAQAVGIVACVVATAVLSGKGGPPHHNDCQNSGSSVSQDRFDY